MELTPELFEKIEFTERRKGYDTEQVETFLEQAGTALAQMLARVRHTEERAAHAEGRLSEAEQKLSQADQVLAEADRRVHQAEQRAQDLAAQQAAGAATAARLTEEAEVEQAAKTLLMAKRTAEATVNEARGQAQSLLEDARNRTDRQLQEANAEAEELIRRAGEQAEAEFAERRATALEAVQALEARRAQLTDVINQLESRLARYRAELNQAADELTAMVEDPARLGARPNMSIQADEVLVSDTPAPDEAEVIDIDAEPVADGVADDLADEEPVQGAASPEVDAADVADAADGGAGYEAGQYESGAQPQAAPAPEYTGPDAAAFAAESPVQTLVDDPVAQAQVADAARVVEEPGDPTQYLDLTAGAPNADVISDNDRWGPGSWSQVEAELDDAGAVQAPETHRDRFMEELDSAVNEAVELDDDAMTAFFEGTGDSSRARRFGWRR